jgi:hypothetical protein
MGRTTWAKKIVGRKVSTTLGSPMIQCRNGGSQRTGSLERDSVLLTLSHCVGAYL